MFNAQYYSKAKKFLKQADKALAKRLIYKIEELQQKPFLHDSKVCEGYKEKLLRVRVGDYRILYEVDHSTNTIGIIRIDKRSKAYKK